ncbi:MAG TPA: hypothetical protein VF363_04910 [Candidatus Eisenbacteria bacterium]
MKRAFWAVALAALLVSACAHLDYIGRTYPPTTRVDLFFSESDVRADYEVMGRVVAHANDIVSAEKLQQKIIEKAQAKGADAVVIEGLERYKSGETTTYSEDSKKKRHGTSTSGSASTSSTMEKQINATFLKYKG